MSAKLRDQVERRADGCCEYCRLPSSLHANRYSLDHIRPQSHDGPTILENLAWACLDCNTFKGTNISGFDPATEEITPLFHPRTDEWNEHFLWNGALLEGATAIGRTTVRVLRINAPDRVRLREILLDAALWQPDDD